MKLTWGAPFRVWFVARLRSSRKRLYSGGETGTPVHAASMVRQRGIVLDAALLGHRRELRRIVVHELFHFAWIRLGNPARRQWEQVLLEEMRGRVRGELGWSAEWRKNELRGPDWRQRSRQWRDYVCESFCDTAAWLLSDSHPRHGEFTLGKRARARRMDWFKALLASRSVKL